MENTVNEKRPILDVENLRVSYHTYAGEVQSVRGVSFDVDRGQVLAIVGESGCGKSVTSRAVMSLIQGPQGEIKKGSKILYNGENILDYDKKKIREFRGGECAMIFQDALTSLNPTMKIGKQIMENLIIHRHMNKKAAKEEAIKILKLVGIPNAEKRINQYPHEFSGGMRQRAMIAIAVACEPKILIADEPTTALDVTIQAQILSLMNKLKNETGTSIMLITHDLGVVAQVADNVNVMYAGKVVETAPVEELFSNPKHPYTIGLMNSMPSLAEEGKRLNTIEGSVPNPLYLPEGCYFADRCPFVSERCKQGQPTDTKVKSRHHVWCFKVEEEMKQEG